MTINYFILGLKIKEWGGMNCLKKKKKKCVAFDIFNLIPQHVDKGSIRPAIDPLAV